MGETLCYGGNPCAMGESPVFDPLSRLQIEKLNGNFLLRLYSESTTIMSSTVIEVNRSILKSVLSKKNNISAYNLMELLSSEFAPPEAKKIESIILDSYSKLTCSVPTVFSDAPFDLKTLDQKFRQAIKSEDLIEAFKMAGEISKKSDNDYSLIESGCQLMESFEDIINESINQYIDQCPQGDPLYEMC
jgi:hypothetical protein